MKPALKEFLMTLAATTVSIVLTFGTSAIVDRKKKNDEKRELVMVILYDMHETLKTVEECDAGMKAFYEQQVDVVAHPQKMDELYADLITNIPVFEYTTTAESIFRSNIETVQTIGNILFVETVSSFYDLRERYKNETVGAFQVQASEALSSYDKLRAFDSPGYIFFNDSFVRLMRDDYEQCKRMMKVTDGELEAFSAQQEKLREATRGNEREQTNEILREQSRRRGELQAARNAGDREREK